MESKVLLPRGRLSLEDASWYGQVRLSVVKIDTSSGAQQPSPRLNNYLAFLAAEEGLINEVVLGQSKNHQNLRSHNFFSAKVQEHE